MSGAGSITNTFAWIFGLYLLATGIGVVIQRDVLKQVVDEMKSSPLLMMIAGILAFSIGAVTVALHNDWSNWLAVIVSLFGWLALTKGVVFLAFPKSVHIVSDAMLGSAKVMVVWGAGVAVCGIVLLVAGLA